MQFKTLSMTCILFSILGCQSPMAQNQAQQPQQPAALQTFAVTTIRAQEAFDWLSDPKATWQVIDVRTPEEFQTNHLQNAQLMNFYDKDFRDKLLNMNRHQPYIIYCQSGNRSGKALNMMRELGFKNAYDIQGGIVAWQNAGYPVVK